MKKYIMVMAAAMALAACSDEEAKQSNEVENNTAEAGEVQAAENEETPAVTEEGPASSPFESEWYETFTADETVVFEEMVDFNKDGIDELVLGTGTHLAVGVFDEAEDLWRSAYEEEAVATGFSGVMENETVGQMAAVETAYEGDNETDNSSLRLLRYTERGNGFEVIEAYRYEGIDSGESSLEYQTTEGELSVLFADESMNDKVLSLQEDQLVSDESVFNLFSGLPLTEDPAFTALFPSYFETGVVPGDSVDTVVEKAGEGEVGYFAGSPTLNYEEFILLHRKDTKLIKKVMLMGNENVTVEDLEAATGQDIEIKEVETQILGDLYTANFTFDDVDYYAEFKSMDGELFFVMAGQ